MVSPSAHLRELKRAHMAKRGVDTGQDSIPAPYERGLEGKVYPIPVPWSELGPGDPPDWLWVGYLARGYVTLLTALWKCGKSTLVAHLLRAFERGGDIAGVIKPSRVLVVSEESAGKWAERRVELDGKDHVDFYTRGKLPYLGKPNLDEWTTLVVKIAEMVKDGDCGYDLVIFDTLPNLWCVREENDAGKVIDAVAPLHIIAEAGAAILLTNHPRKSQGAAGRASRGSGALPGFVDFVLELDYPASERGKQDRRRVLTGLSRFEDTHEKVVIELTNEGYRLVGTIVDATRQDRSVVIDQILANASSGLTCAEVRDRWLPDCDIPSPKESTFRADLNAGADAGRWLCEGKGVRGDPLRYRLKDSIPASPASIGRGNE